MLRAWRDHVGMSAIDLARTIPVQKATISMWEGGDRARRAAASIDTVQTIGRRLRLTEHLLTAMTDLWRAAGSVEALPPRTDWAHNFQPPSGPAWAWLRPSAGCTTLAASFWWGEPLQGRLDAVVSPHGVVVQLPTSVSNPPLQIILEQPGWVDFGRGMVPPDVADRLGIGLIISSKLMGHRAPTDPPLSDHDERLIQPWFARARALADEHGLTWALIAPHLGYAARRERKTRPLDVATSEPAVAVDGAGMIVSQLLITPEQVRRLRDACGLSRDKAAAEATELDSDRTVSSKMVEGIEAHGRTPEGVHLISRLDLVYRADGRIGTDRTFSSWSALPGKAGRYDVRFPEYWHGPVWLQVRGPTPEALALVELTWGLWGRRQHVKSGAVLSTRKATTGMPALQVRLPSGWKATAGTGYVPAAADINRGWYPVSVRAAIALLREGIRSVKRDRHAFVET